MKTIVDLFSFLVRAPVLLVSYVVSGAIAITIVAIVFSPFWLPLAIFGMWLLK